MKPVSKFRKINIREPASSWNNLITSEVSITEMILYCNICSFFYRKLHVYFFEGGAQEARSATNTGILRSCGHSVSGSSAVCTSSAP